jgi:hypothetical protein
VRLAALLATVLAASLTPLLWPAASTAATSTASTTSGATYGITTAPPTTTTSGGIGSCEQYPPMASFVSATSTSLTFAITWSGPNCGYGGAGRLTLNTQKNFDGAIEVSISPNTTVTVPNLKPGTAYYWGTQGSSPVSSGWQGPASTLPSGSATTTTIACDPRQPDVGFVSATATSLTFSYKAYGTASCGGERPVSVQVSPDKTNTNSVVVNAPWPSGTVTVPNLAPATAYYYSASGGGSPFGNPWFGPVSTLAGPTTTTTWGTCDPLPPQLTFLSATAGSLTFSYKSWGASACGDTDSVIVHVRLPGASADTATVSAPSPSGTVTVPGLAAGTTYQYGASGGGSPFGTDWYGTAATLGGPTTSTSDGGNGCSASYVPLSSWPGNFMANLVVKNVSSVPFTGWKVTWTWPGGQTLVAAYSATAGGSGANPVVTNPSWGGKIQPGGTAETVLMNAGSPPASAPVLTCTVLN